MTRMLIKHMVTGTPLANSLRVFSPSCALAFKKSSFLKINGFDENLKRLEDIDFACRALRHDLILNWSSEIALERYHSLGNDKSAKANFDGEISVLKSVRDILGIKDYFVARQMAFFRYGYLDKNFTLLLKKSHLLPMIILIAPSKVIAVLKRLKHDFAQRA